MNVLMSPVVPTRDRGVAKLESGMGMVAIVDWPSGSRGVKSTAPEDAREGQIPAIAVSWVLGKSAGVPKEATSSMK